MTTTNHADTFLQRLTTLIGGVRYISNRYRKQLTDDDKRAILKVILDGDREIELIRSLSNEDKAEFNRLMEKAKKRKENVCQRSES